MDETYYGKLGDPYPHPQVHIGEHEETPPDNDGEAIHIQPHIQSTGREGQPIPIQLPNIYVHPYPPRERTPPPPPPPPPAPAPAQPPVTSNLAPPPAMPKGKKIGPFRWTKPHPLLWVSLILSFIALVLEVPKGSLPTLTGRHKVLRAQEKLVEEKLHLLTQLSTFLPPPLSGLVAPLDPTNPIATSLLALDNRRQLELLRLAPQLRFWNAATGSPYGVGIAGSAAAASAAGGNEGDRWWSVEEVGQGASVVKSKGEGQEREVWVLRVGEDGDGTHTTALTSALTHSLLLRDRLQSEVAHLKSISCPVCPTPGPGKHLHLPISQTRADILAEQEEEAHLASLREERERLEERKRREKVREREVEEREKEVGRREKWVVEEMRKLSDKVHSQATELTLEDRITERMKAYQRQLANMKERNEL